MSDERKEIRGILASQGMAWGQAVVLPDFEASVPHLSIGADGLQQELERLERSIQDSERQIEGLLNGSELPDEHKALFEAQMLMLRDPMLVDETRQAITTSLVNTEWALATVLDRFKEILRRTRDPLIIERVNDLEDIGNRLIANLMNLGTDDIRLPYVQELEPGSIVVAESITPSLMLQMDRRVAGIITEKGGVTGHMAILCRDRGIPAIVGAEGALSAVQNGDDLFLNAVSGTMVVLPDSRDLHVFEKHRKETGLLDIREIHSPVDLHGASVGIWVNLDNDEDAMHLHVAGVEGVGLFRTEFLYLKDPFLLENFPAQIQIYSGILKFLKGKKVTFRLLDLGDDKTLHAPIYRYAGSATDTLSLRGIRFLLANPGILRSQIYSILIAAIQEEIQDNQCRIMIPMVTRLEEIQAVREILENLIKEVEKDSGKSAPRIPLGIMIETPAACLMADIFSKEADFFSLGTNDLATYTLALRRTESQKDDQQFYQPALYRMIFEAVRRSTVPISICGEIAGIPELIPLIVGLGVQNLSVAVGGLSRTYETLRKLDHEQCRELATAVAQATDVMELLDLLKKHEQSDIPV